MFAPAVLLSVKPVGVVPTTGVTLTAGDGLLVPEGDVAVTLHEYVVPFVSPVTVSGLLVPVVFNESVPAVQVAVYCVPCGAPPPPPWVLNVIIALLSPVVAVTFCGGPGTGGGRNEIDIVCSVFGRPPIVVVINESPAGAVCGTTTLN